MSSCNGNCSTCTSDLRLQEFIKIRDYYSFKENFNYNYKEYSLPTSIMLGLTDDCNLACSYCFVKQNKNYITLETAEKTILWALENGKKKQQKPYIVFFGGEPLLQFNEIIIPIVKKYHNDVDFGITTNGLLLNEDVVDFLYKYNIPPLLSFDGIPKVQNSQRKAKNGNSFNEILNNIPYLLLRFPNTIMRSTITKESIPFLYDTFLMAEELGFSKITFCPNGFEDWDKDIEKELYNQFDKIGLHIYKKLLKEQYPVIEVDPIITNFGKIELALNNNLFFNNSLLRCGLGTTSCAVTPKGEIIPCQEKISNPTWIIGNIEKGINEEKHKEFLKWYLDKVNNIKCDKACGERNTLICLSDICPSRLEDMNFEISTSVCAFNRVTSRIAARLHFLCANSYHPYIKQYFDKGERIECR